MSRWPERTDADYLAFYKGRTIVNERRCWIWQGWLAKFRNQKPGQPGYAESSYRGKKVRVHRKMLEIKLGRLLEKQEQACHECDTPPCINPDHLYPGTNQKNHLDGGKRKRMQGQTKTHCDNGHEFNEENTYWSKRGLSFCRNCKACARLRHRARYRADPEAARAKMRRNRASLKARRLAVNGTEVSK